jgi:glutamate-1-semialdehyde aminotransferase
MSMGIGPLVLGYRHPSVDEAIRAQLDEGITFSLPHVLEVEVAERIQDLVPNAERVRFGKTGAEVTSAAVRLARAFTGRSGVVCCGYHGWHDWYIGVTDRDRGVPEGVRRLTSTFEYDDLASLDEALDSDVACVILEPVVFQEPRPGFLEAVRDRCRARGALLVFDEMWTGFRLALGGAQEVYGVSPDLATFSKAVANGMPLSVLTGRADVMELLEREVFFFSTFGGEALSLAAARATLDVLEAERIPERLAERGARIREGYEQLAAAHGLSSVTRCAGPAARTLVSFEATRGFSALELKSLVQQELLRRRVLWTGTNTLSAAHGEAEAAHLLNAYDAALGVLADALDSGNVRTWLRGEPVEPVFRRTSRFNTKPRAR